MVELQSVCGSAGPTVPSSVSICLQYHGSGIYCRRLGRRCPWESVQTRVFRALSRETACTLLHAFPCPHAPVRLQAIGGGNWGCPQYKMNLSKNKTGGTKHHTASGAEKLSKLVRNSILMSAR